jgi:hypothetical protein
MVSGTMESSSINVLDISENLVPYTWMLIIVHVQDVHNHLIDNLCLSIVLGVERSGFCYLGVQ